MRQLKPMKDRVWVERIEKPTTIVLTDADPTRFAKVLSIGPKVYDVKPGDMIFLPGIAAREPDWDNKETILVQQADIGGIISA